MNNMNHNEECPKVLFWTTKYGTIALVLVIHIEMNQFFTQNI